MSRTKNRMTNNEQKDNAQWKYLKYTWMSNFLNVQRISQKKKRKNWKSEKENRSWFWEKKNESEAKKRLSPLLITIPSFCCFSFLSLKGHNSAKKILWSQNADNMLNEAEEIQQWNQDIQIYIQSSFRKQRFKTFYMYNV